MSVNEGMSQHLSGAQTTTVDKTKRGRRRNRTNQKVFLISSIVVAMAVTLHLLQSSKCDHFDVAKLFLSLSLFLWALCTVFGFLQFRFLPLASCGVTFRRLLAWLKSWSPSVVRGRPYMTYVLQYSFFRRYYLQLFVVNQTKWTTYAHK